MFVNYHINIGIDHMYLFFDDPDDIVIDELEKYSQVTSVICNSEFWRKRTQKSELSLRDRLHICGDTGLDWARQAGYDWFIRIDSDELIYSEKQIKKVLAKYPENIHVVNFPTMEAVHEKVHYDRVFEEVNLFKLHPGPKAPPGLYKSQLEDFQYKLKRLSYRLRCKLASWLGCRTIIRGKYLRGHFYGKAAVRTNADICRTMSHFPVPSKGQELKLSTSGEARLLHFDCCGFEYWRTKWLKRSKDTVHIARMESHRREQYQKFLSAYQSGDTREMMELYKKQYFLLNKEKAILSQFGLLKRIQLKSKLFESNIQSM